MSIKTLRIHDFRNIEQIAIDLNTSSNIFYGDNGAGKTSILEAIYYLGTGRSFKTRLNQRVIKYNQPCLLISISTIDSNNSKCVMGIERQQSGARRIRINQETNQSLELIAKSLPIQLLSTYSYRYFHDGSKERRQFLDWGIFYNEPNYIKSWRTLQRLMKQRNAALKLKSPRAEVIIWDNDIVSAAELTDTLRSTYLDKFTPIFQQILKNFLPDESLELRYDRGWSPEKALSELLSINYYKDSQLGYTQYGPHKADLQLYKANTNIPAHDYLSQGQQKLAAYALHLAQGMLLYQETAISPIYLIDDLPSELDLTKRQLVFELLETLNSQIFITCINKDDLPELKDKNEFGWFHVKLGAISSAEVADCFEL